MKNALILIFIFSFNLCFSQTILILDKSSNEMIPFVNFVCGTSTAYSNENGLVDLTEFHKDSTITITAIGYKNKITKKSSIIDSVFLEPVDFVLSEIVLLGDEKIKQKTKKLKDSKKLGNQVLPCHTNIITKITAVGELVDKRITSIIIPFDKHSGFSKKQKKVYASSKLLIRLNIFKVEGDSIGELIYTSPIKDILTGEKDEVIFNLNEVNLEFLKEGFYLQLENLGAINEEGDFIENKGGLFMARAKISDQESKEFKIESYRLSKNGSVDVVRNLNYTQAFGNNDLDKNYFLNYRFEYYD